MAVMESRDGVTGKWTDAIAPGRQGLYDPSNEKEACGVGFVVQIDGIRSNKVRSFPFYFYLISLVSWELGTKMSCLVVYLQILQDARVLSSRLNHRGAQSADNNTGDGAGVLTAIPHAFYASVVR